MKAASYGVSIDSMCVHISSMTSMKHVDEVDRSQVASRFVYGSV